MHEHVSNMSLPRGSSEGRRPTCPYCFRRYLSPFQLQSHIKAVHHPADQPAGVCLSVSDTCVYLFQLFLRCSQIPSTLIGCCDAVRFTSLSECLL